MKFDPNKAANKLFFVVIGYCLGMLVFGGFLYNFITIPGTNDQIKINDLKKAKEKCEMAIPRNKVCHLEWRYKED